MSYKPKGWSLSPLLLLVAILVEVGSLTTLAQTQTARVTEQLSPGVQQQIRELQEEKASRSPLHRKLDSQFVYQLKQNRHEAFAPSATEFRPDVKFEKDGRVMVDIDATVSPELLDQITNVGGTVLSSYPRFNAIRALVPLDQMETLAGSADVQFIKRPVPARTHTGSVDSQGDTTHSAISARSTFGVNGTGMKVGILSDSVTHLSTSQSTGDLPTNVVVLSGQSGTGISGVTGEGTAMLEIVNDLAPGAQLYFATAFNSEASFAQNILDLRSNGCNIIADDVSYFDESPFQDGIVAQAVSTVTASGALYFSSAGNDGNVDNGTSSTWEGDYVDGGAVSSPITGTDHVHNFGGTNYDIVLDSPGLDVALFWADPAGASTNDYDLYILNPGGTAVVASSTNPQNGSQNPFELALTTAVNDRVVVTKAASAAGRFLHVSALGDGLGRLSLGTTGATLGHNAATNAFSVAAVDANTAYPNPFTTSSPVEYFSSDGPRRMFFTAAGAAITPGNFSSTGGQLRQKPDIAAADGVNTSVSGFAPFYGTSAAAPHAAAIAALLWSYNPTLTTAQMRTALTNTALDIMAAGVDRDDGYGIVMPGPAMQSVTFIPQLVLTNTVLLGESCSNNAIDPGETVTVGFVLRNKGSTTFSNLVVTLLATNGVTAPGNAQTNGAMAGGANFTNAFTFTATGSCGGSITCILNLQFGTNTLTPMIVTLPLGQLVSATTFSQNFDSITAPALPAGWTTTNSGGQAVWTTSTVSNNTAPNSAFSAGATTAGVNELVTPAISIASTNAQLSFRNNYNLQNTSSTRRDGGVLEIKIGTGAFTDILAAGGSFVSGGYIATLSTSRSNPLGGRSAWTGNSSGFTNTVVTLPASAAGQTVQFKWRCGTDSSTGSTGWWVDTIAINESFYSCCSNGSSVADLAIGKTASPAITNVGGGITFTLNITNLGSLTASNVVVTDTLPAGITFVSATPVASSTNAGVYTFIFSTLAGGARTNITIQTIGASAGARTNTATVSSATADATNVNNSASAVVTINAFPVISAFANVTNNEDTVTGPIAFTVSDTETVASALAVTAASSNPGLIPTNNIVFGGSGTNRTVTLTPATNQSGPATITLTVNDGLATASNSFLYVVLPVNDPPVLAAISNRTILEMTTLQFTNIASDPETNNLTFSLGVGAPTNAAVNPTNGVFTWTPTEAQGPSTNTISVIVTDDGVPPMSATQSFTVIVLESNLPPVLAAISNQTIFELTTLVITNTATDPDIPTNILTFSLNAGAPTNATINPTNGVFTWTPTEAQGPSTNPITVRVTDNGSPSLSATQSFTVVVLESNLPPILAAVSNQTIFELTTLVITNTATDPDIPTNILTFSLDIGAPTNAVINPTNGVFTWTPTEAQGPGTNAITVRVTDNGSPSLSATQSFTVVVLESNLPPVLAAISNRTIFELTTLVITNIATDPDIPANILTFSLAAGAPTNATIDPTNGVFSWTPIEAQSPGSNAISVIVTDNGTPSLSATQSFIVTVLESNTPPSLAAISNQTIVELTTLVITNIASDSDIPTNILTFSLGVGAPTNALINPTNGVFTWTPTEAQGPGTNTISIIVTDNGTPPLTATQSFTVIVLESNLPPVLAAISNQTIFEMTTLVVTNIASDPDIPANILAFSLDAGAPTNAVINPTNGLFTWTPIEAQGPSSNYVSVIVTDNGSPSLSATQSFTILVLESNLPPVLTAISNQTIVELTTLVITNTASDPDIPANILAFSLGAGAPTNAAINPTNGVFTWTPTEAQGPSSNNISVIVTDNGTPPLSAAQTFTVTVLESNLPPVLSAISNQTIFEMTTLVITNIASDPDSPANILTFSLDTGAPTNAVINPTSGVFTWTPTEGQGPSSNNLSVIVADNGTPSLSATQTFIVTVLESNLPPVLAVIPDHAVHAGSTLVVAISATDPDIPANTLTYSLDAGHPATASIDATNGLITWPTVEADDGTTNTFTVRVTDDGIPPLSDVKTFQVAVAPRPIIVSVSVAGTNLTVSWSAIAGQDYRLQHKDDLGDSNWTDEPSNVTAAGPVEFEIIPLSVPQRFYRVLVP